MKHLHTILFTTLVLLVLSPGLTTAQTVTRGPYLQQSTPESVTIVWRTDVATDGVVRWGDDPAALDQTDTGPDATQHEVTITGLQPGAVYYYSVGNADGDLAGGDADHYFETPEPAGSTVPFRAWIVGDSGTGGSRQAEVRDAMLAEVGDNRPDVFIHVGDMAYGSGTNTEFQENFFEMYPSVLRNTVCWPAMGNHEGRTSDSDTQSGPYYDAYVLPTNGSAGGVSSGTEAYYSWDRHNVHFIVLDSHDSPRASTGTMATWLQQDLAATDQDWIIAYWHHPPYTKGSHDSDSEGRLIDMREEILPILEAGGVDLVLAGHSHIYERSYLVNGAYDTPTTAAGYILDPSDGDPNGDGAYVKVAGASEGAVYVVAGHGGTGVSGPADHPLMYFSEVENGSCILDVDGDLLRLANIRYDGMVTDEFAMLRGEGVFLLRPADEELIQAAEPYEIRWVATDTQAVKVEFTPDDGVTWQVLAEEVTGNSFTWDVPAEPTNLARIRITDADDPTRTATNERPFVITDQTPEIVVPFGSVWRYVDDGTADEYGDLSWTEPGYDDSAWQSGAAELGYGDGDETTELQDADPNVPSVLFRHTVMLERAVDEATLEAIFDDAIAVWINGELVHQENIGDLAFDAYAAGSSGDNAPTSTELGRTNPFVSGENVIAVMVKQRSEDSSDVSLDFQLTVTMTPDFPDPPPMDGMEPTGDAGNAGDAAPPPPADGGPTTPPDASTGSDVASDGGPMGSMNPTTEDPGCGCGVSPGATPLGILLALGLLLGLRRRT